MKSKVVLLVLALLMVGSFTTAAVALVKVSGDGEKNGQKDDRAAHGKAHDKSHGKARGHDKTERPRGFGPPPWAGEGRLSARGEWREYWRSLTPEQRAEKMAELVEQHADAMKKWAACLREAGADRAERAACERPRPPGLGKKLLSD